MANETKLRRIEFRGKDLETGTWRYGSLSQCNHGKEYFISDQFPRGEDQYAFSYEVVPKTVGQLIVAQGDREFYEGDIIKNGENKGTLMIRNGNAVVCFSDDRGILLNFIQDPKILGNIHDKKLK